MTAIYPSDDLIQRGVRLLEVYMESRETADLKRLAPVVVDLRESFTLSTGHPDLQGRTPQYRRAIAEMFARARVPEEEVEKVQAALRYHVSNELRARFHPNQLAAVGLGPESARDRLANTRRAHAAEREVSAPRQDIARLTTYAFRLLNYVDEASIPNVERERLIAARSALEHVQTLSAELLVRVKDALAAPPKRDGGGGTQTVFFSGS